jgi:hypothetical protein
MKLVNELLNMYRNDNVVWRAGMTMLWDMQELPLNHVGFRINPAANFKH